MIKRFSSFEFPYHFYDYQIKTNLEIGPNHRLTYSRFYGRDVLDFSFSEQNTVQNRVDRFVDTLNWPWGNRTNGLTWRWIIAPTLIAKTFLSTSDYRFEFDFATETTELLTEPDSTVINREKVNFEVKDNIDDRNIDSELLWKINEEHDLTTGIQHKEVSFDLDLTVGIATLDTSLQRNPLAINSKTCESALYIQDRWTINPRLSVLGGLRATDYSLHDKLYLEPRIGAKFAATEKLFVKYTGDSTDNSSSPPTVQTRCFALLICGLACPVTETLPWRPTIFSGSNTSATPICSCASKPITRVLTIS